MNPSSQERLSLATVKRVFNKFPFLKSEMPLQ